MKNIIICGVARSGKTTLANMLREKTNCSIVSTDDFIGSFHHTFPELEISHQDEFKNQ